METALVKPVAFPTGVLEEFQCSLYDYLRKSEKKIPNNYHQCSLFYISSLVFFKLFLVKNFQMKMEFFNHSDQEFLDIPTEFRLEKQLAYLHSFVASLHPIWFGHEGDVLIISHQLVPLMLKCFIYSSTT